ncbi:helix-turn-helix transcriptional regulator [Candidatus Latescibacterota bacterium]
MTIKILLEERIKELNCLYGISKLLESDNSLENIFSESVNILKDAWQYPEITCVKINIENDEFKTSNYIETNWKQTSDIKLRNECIGKLEVNYLKKMPDRFEGPFLKEERNLIDAIAERFGKVIERKKALSELRTLHNDLEKKAINLQELNIALEVLLKHQDDKKNELEKNILTSLEILVLPYLEKIKNRTSEEDTINYINIIIKNLNEVSKPFLGHLTNNKITNLTPIEIQTANLIRENKKTKDIARILNLSENTIFSYRKSIRKKLCIQNQKINLTTYLKTFLN